MISSRSITSTWTFSQRRHVLGRKHDAQAAVSGEERALDVYPGSEKLKQRFVPSLAVQPDFLHAIPREVARVLPIRRGAREEMSGLQCVWNALSASPLALLSVFSATDAYSDHLALIHHYHSVLARLNIDLCVFSHRSHGEG